MAATVTRYESNTEVIGQPNTVVKVAPFNWYMIVRTDGAGQRRLCLGAVAGTSTVDGQPAVYILMEDEEIKQRLRMATPSVTAGVRRELAKAAEVSADNIPEGAMDGLLASMQLSDG
jgi:hypothetical protein